MKDEHVATYIYDERLDYGVYEVYACYDSALDKYQRNVSHYAIYDKSGVCVNQLNPCYQIPTWQEIFDKYYLVNAN